MMVGCVSGGKRGSWSRRRPPGAGTPADRACLEASMSQSTLPDLNASGTDDASDDDESCLCETTDLGCFRHYDGGSRLEEVED